MRELFDKRDIASAQKERGFNKQVYKKKFFKKIGSWRHEN